MKKYIQGEVIKNFAELMELIDNNKYVFMRDQPKHPAVIVNMNIKTIDLFIKGNGLHKAIVNPEWIKKQKEIKKYG